MIPKRTADNAAGRKRRAATGDWYDYPQYYDLAFVDDTPVEADFIEAVCRRYAVGPVRSMCEPGCGGGRLVVEMARRGYRTTGLDDNRRALAHLQRRIARRRLPAAALFGDMTDFRLPRPVDAAFCTFNTFRHLTDDAAALGHLRSTARALRPGGLYVLGFHLLPLDVDESCIERWRAQRGRTRVHFTLRVVEFNRRRRLERLRVTMRVDRPQGTLRLANEFPFRIYTAEQFCALLARVPQFELCDVFDFGYDAARPLPLDDERTDAVFILRRR